METDGRINIGKQCNIFPELLTVENQLSKFYRYHISHFLMENLGFVTRGPWNTRKRGGISVGQARSPVMVL